MKTFKEILNEKTYSLDRDVNYLYRISKLDDLLNFINSENYDKLDPFLRNKKVSDGYELYSTDSSKLTNRDIKKSHKLNPITIRIGIFNGGSFFNVKTKVMQISLNKGAFDLFNYNSFDDIKRDIGFQFTKFKNEFTEHNIKGSIYHELVHWIEESTHDSMLSKRINKGNIKGKHANVNHTEFEINSQIHKIKQLRKSLNKKEYDDLDWKQLLQKLPSLSNNFKNYRNEKEFNTFVKNFISRLHREKLLPKKIKNVPTKREIENIIFNI